MYISAMFWRKKLEMPYLGLKVNVTIGGFFISSFTLLYDRLPSMLVNRSQFRLEVFLRFTLLGKKDRLSSTVMYRT